MIKTILILDIIVRIDIEKIKKRNPWVYTFAFALDAALATMMVRITAIIVTSIA